jgi:pilus assembly protein CpaB
MKRRGLTIALAVLLAVFGTVGVLVYVTHANSRAIAGQKPVTVVIAEKLIPSGTSAADAQRQGLVGTETLPAASVPADAITALTPTLSGLVTSAAVQPGQLLLRQMLVTQSQTTSGLSIPRGMVAVSVLFCTPEAVAGNVHAGSKVAVFDTVVTGTNTMTAQPACTGPHQWLAGDQASTHLALAGLQVLAVGSASSGSGSGSGNGLSGTSSSSSQNTQLLTLAVSQSDAEKLILMTQDSLPYLALQNDGSALGVTTTTGVSAPGR